MANKRALKVRMQPEGLGLKAEKSAGKSSSLPYSAISLSFLLLTAYCLLFFTGCKKHEEEKIVPQNAVVIMINDREITYGEFQDTFKRLFIEGETNVEAMDEELKNLKMALINQFIEEELMSEEAKKLALDVSDKELSRELEEIKKEYAGDTFESAIVTKYGSMEKWKEELKKKLLIKKVIDKVITSGLTVKESDARKYYREHIADYKVREQVRARMIVVKTEEEANQIREKLKKGESFAKLAEAVSLSPEGKKGGDLGFFGRGDMPKEFEDVVFSLPVGTLSQVIKTAYGYHIFMVVEKRGAKNLQFPEVKNQIINMLKKQKSDAEFQIWMRELKQKARIEVKEELL